MSDLVATNTGYSLCSATNSAFSELLSRSLPAVQRDIGPVKLSEALQILAGPAWLLKVDEVNREICFVLRDQYRQFDAAATALTPAKSTTLSYPVQPKPVQSKGPTIQKNSLPRNPFTGENLPVAGQKTALTPQSLPVPSPALTTDKAQKAQKSANSLSVMNTPISVQVPAAKVAPQPVSSAAGVRPPAVSQTTVNVAPKASSVRPVTTLPPAPPVSSQTAASLIPGTPVTVAPVGQTWRAEPGSTLKETLTGWASKAPCSNGGNWVVIWPVSLDYRIDAPLIFHGNFESVMVQVFDLYRKAEKPLFAEANRIQCLISVSDTPAGGGH
ncbi:TcpQ domain-containing protein [Candidatus Symbiopectobacterium sp.]|uniref:PFGI-1 class ICE element type IV pilus protein PilL2 n=1 Tax=Candidatus Symbiopectobacterium sp. TaxID=2816440 RepID=UPI0025B7D1D7|nr:TcpQ domain-containing protein [Candidatus Symbiopectobacterium sp.]